MRYSIRIGYDIPMFCGFVIMFFSTLSKYRQLLLFVSSLPSVCLTVHPFAKSIIENRAARETADRIWGT